MRRFKGLLAAGVLAGCASPSAPPPPPPPAPLPAPPPVSSAPPRVALPPAPVSIPPAPPPDQCGAYSLVGLVGRPRTEIPIPLDPSRRRVVCTTCPRTMEFRADRLTIEFDAGTGRVTRVGCG